MKYYHSNEEDRILTLDDVKKEYEERMKECSKEEMEIYGDNFSYYLSACMHWNNGDLTPLQEHVENLRKDLSHWFANPDNDEDIAEKKAWEEHIAELEKLLTE